MSATSLLERFNAPSPRSVADDLRIEMGDLADYKSLAAFHYKSAHPGAVTSVLRMVHHAPTVVGRFLAQRGQTQVVGVLVRSLPPLCCRLRDVATNNRYGGLAPRDAAALLNREVRTISRVVIDPTWRGLSLAVQLVRHALEHPLPTCGFRPVFTEALAAMGRVSPFFERAGMTRYDRPPRDEHARLLDALDHLSIEPATLASHELMNVHLHRLNPVDRAWIESELRRWHRAAHRTIKKRLLAMSVDDLLSAARHELLAQPVYYLFRHTDSSITGLEAGAHHSTSGSHERCR